MQSLRVTLGDQAQKVSFVFLEEFHAKCCKAAYCLKLGESLNQVVVIISHMILSLEKAR